MKLQFAFGNPRKKRKKGVAKRKKSKKNRSVIKKSTKAMKHMTKRKRRKGRRTARKNPLKYTATKKFAHLKGKGKRKTGSFPTKKEWAAKFAREVAAFKKKHGGVLDYDAHTQLLHIKKAAYDKHKAAATAFISKIKQYKKHGWDVKTVISNETGGSVAKKRKSKKRKTRKVKAASKRRASKRKGGKRKSAKRGKRGKRKGMSAKAKRAFVARMKKARKAKHPKRKASKRKSSKRGKRGKRRTRMITHKHAKSTRHVRRGAKARVTARKRKGSYKIKTHFGRGKKRVRLTGSLRPSKSGLKGIFKINPFRRNPMTDAIAKFTGLNNKELQLLAIGAAAAPISAALLPRIPGLNTVVGMVAGYIPAKYQSAGVNLLLGVALNAVAGKVGGQGGKYAGMVGEGLAAASIIQLVSSMATDGLRAAGMAGVNYTPQMRGLGIMPQLNGMRGVSYTPQMRGMGDVRYTPQMRGIGSSADFGSADYGGGGGYTEAHNRSRADFGANFSQDSIAEGLESEDNSYSSSMN